MKSVLHVKVRAISKRERFVLDVKRKDLSPSINAKILRRKRMEIKERLIIEKEENHLPVIYVNLDTDIEEPMYYREVFEKLESADDKTKFIFNINSYGGFLSTTIQFINSIRNAKAETVARVYTAKSAASIIALSCKKIEVMPHSVMMVHNIQWGAPYGDVNKGKWRMDYATQYAEKLFKDIYNGFLTEEEIEKVVKEGKEIWLIESEIKERLKNRGKNGN